MQDKDNNASAAIYRAVSKYIALDTIDEEQKEKMILKSMKISAVHTLDTIRQVLEDDSYDDPECFERVDALIMLFYRELGINIHRHTELE